MLTILNPLYSQDQSALAVQGSSAQQQEEQASETDEVFRNYLEAIGGMDRIQSINSIFIKYEAFVNGMTIASEERRINGKLALNTYINGTLFQSVITTPEAVYQKQGDNKTAFPETVASEMKPMAGLCMELNFLNSDKALLSGIEEVNGRPAYRIEVPGEVISMSLFYDVETGLKIKEVQNISFNGNTQSQQANLNEYKEFGGLRFPSIREGTLQGQLITFKLVEVKIDEGVSEADFN